MAAHPSIRIRLTLLANFVCARCGGHKWLLHIEGQWYQTMVCPSCQLAREEEV
jgi:phage FluMu protein Com